MDTEAGSENCGEVRKTIEDMIPALEEVQLEE